MNHIYKTMYNSSLGTWVAVPETAKSGGKAVGSNAITVLEKGKYFFMTAIASSIVLMSGQAMAVTGDKEQLANGSGNVCYFDTASNSVICGNAATTNNSTSNSTVIGANANSGNHGGAVIIGSNASANFQNTQASASTVHRAYNNPYSTFQTVSGTLRDANGNEIRSSVVAVGQNAHVQGGGVAVGDNARAEVGTGNTNNERVLGVAVGANALSRAGGVSIGSSAETRGVNAIALGRQAVAAGDSSQAYGSASAAVGKGSLAVGNSATSTGERSIAIGMSESVENYTNATNVKAEGTDSIAIGSIARAHTDTSISIGRNAG